MSDNNNTNNPNQLNIEISEETAEGVNSNLVIVGHSNSEFILDFVKIIHGTPGPKGRVKSRIILTPQNTRRLLKTLQDNIAKFESKFGKIDEQDQPPIPMNFGGPTAQA